MRRDEHDAIRNRHGRVTKTGRPSTRRLVEAAGCVVQRLLIIERVQTRAARVADENDPLEAGAFEKIQTGRNVQQRDLMLDACRYQPIVLFA